MAHNGRQALAQIGQTVPDAMILDLMMPEVDGLAVLKAIREVPRSSQIPVLILTAKHVSRDELSFLKRNHIYQLIQKGDINRDGLLAAVAGMLVPPVVPPVTPPVLPLLTPAAPSRQRRLSRPGKPLVLVVEDNPDNMRTARALLADDYQLIEATDGRSGIEQARRHQPDIILTDIGLPVVDGLQALEANGFNPRRGHEMDRNVGRHRPASASSPQPKRDHPGHDHDRAGGALPAKPLPQEPGAHEGGKQDRGLAQRRDAGHWRVRHGPQRNAI